MDVLSRRSWVASTLIHGLVVGLALLPQLVLHHPPESAHAAPAKPMPAQRLILVPMSAPSPPPLPALGAAALPGSAAAAVDRAFAEVITPRTGGNGQHNGSGTQSGNAPVTLPVIPLAAIERATRFDGHAWSARELSLEQERLGDMATFLEKLLRDQYQTWEPSTGEATHPELFLSVTVDAHGRVTAAMRVNSTGSTQLDEAIDRWLHDPEAPISLPPIAPGVAHVLKVTLYGH
jgi:hypothetical protein